MKIAYIVNNYGEISETFVRDLANGFVKEGHSVTVFCNQNKNQDLFSNPHQFEDIKELKFLTISLVTKITDRLNRVLKNEFRQQNLFDIQQKNANKKLLPALKKYQPDVAFIDFGVVAVQVQLALEQLNIPFFVHFHAFDITLEGEETVNTDHLCIYLPYTLLRLLALAGFQDFSIGISSLGIEKRKKLNIFFNLINILSMNKYNFNVLLGHDLIIEATP